MRAIITIPVALLLLAGAVRSTASERAASTVSAQAASAAPAEAPGGIWKPLGAYRVTAYSACVKCCGKSDGITADGTYAPGFGGWLASAPKEIPFGARVWISGVGAAEVHDRGGAIKGRRLELFFRKYNDALQWGVQRRQVWVWVPSN